MRPEDFGFVQDAGRQDVFRGGKSWTKPIPGGQEAKLFLKYDGAEDVLMWDLRVVDPEKWANRGRSSQVYTGDIRDWEYNESSLKPDDVPQKMIDKNKDVFGEKAAQKIIDKNSGEAVTTLMIARPNARRFSDRTWPPSTCAVNCIP